MMERLIIDRIEESFAVCEKSDETMIELDRALLPSQAKEGDCLVLLPDGTYSIDQEQTQVRRERAAQRLRRLFEK